MRECSPPTMHHMSGVTCQVSGVRYELSRVTCQVSPVTIFYLYFFGQEMELVGGEFVITWAYPVCFLKLIDSNGVGVEVFQRLRREIMT